METGTARLRRFNNITVLASSYCSGFLIQSPATFFSSLLNHPDIDATPAARLHIVLPVFIRFGSLINAVIKVDRE